VKATVPYIEKKFEEFNRQMFRGKLPKIPVELSDAKTFLGQCVFKKRRKPFGKTELYDFRLRINTRVDLPERDHVIAVVNFHDGRTGIKVLPRVLRSILYYYNNVLANKDISSIQLYMSNNVFFNRYPNSSALKVHFLEADEINKQLAGAEKMACDGKSIKRNQ